MHFGDVAHASLRASEAASLPPLHQKREISNIERPTPSTFNDCISSMFDVRSWRLNVQTSNFQPRTFNFQQVHSLNVQRSMFVKRSWKFTLSLSKGFATGPQGGGRYGGDTRGGTLVVRRSGWTVKLSCRTPDAAVPPLPSRVRHQVSIR